MLFYKIKFSYLCTPIDKTTQKNFYKINFSYLCTPIDKTTEKNFYKIKFSFLCRDSGMNFLIFCFFGRCIRGFWRQILVYTLITDASFQASKLNGSYRLETSIVFEILSEYLLTFCDLQKCLQQITISKRLLMLEVCLN